MDFIQKNQKQFGPAAEHYAKCPVQSNDFTLKKMVELAKPQKNWTILDIATGAGHTSLAFAPYVKEVIATDITKEMLAAGEQSAKEGGISNIKFEYADAMNLPFEDASFDLVTSRLAAHHFQNVSKFLSECSRLLSDNGTLAIVDSPLPDDSAGKYINKIQKLHDPSHVKCLSRKAWLELLTSTNFELIESAEGRVELDFLNWTTRVNTSVENTQTLKKLLLEAPPEAAKILDTRIDDGYLKFHFQRLILIATKRKKDIS